MRTYTAIWLKLTSSAFQIAFISRFGAALFIFAKLLRFIFLLLMVFLVVSKTRTLAGFTLTQSLIFFLTFNVIDTLTQLLFRDVYRFRQQIVNGYFDYVLIKPMNPLFKVLFGGADPLDLIMLIPYGLILIYLIGQVSVTIASLAGYLLLIVNAFLIATGFHVLVVGMAILTTEIDHTIMIYRDISSMARFPVDIYREPLRGLITFVIPVGIMMTFPPKALFGLFSPIYLLVACGIGISILVISLFFWKYALTKYTSASS